MKSIISKDWVDLSRRVEENYDTMILNVLRWPEHSAPVYNWAVWGKERDRNRSESRPWRRGKERGKGRERKEEIDRKEDVSWDLPSLTKDCVYSLFCRRIRQTGILQKQKDSRTPVRTCPCRSVLSSMRAQVNVWAPSATRQHHTNSCECNVTHFFVSHADTNYTS